MSVWLSHKRHSRFPSSGLGGHFCAYKWLKTLAGSRTIADIKLEGIWGAL